MWGVPGYSTDRGEGEGYEPRHDDAGLGRGSERDGQDERPNVHENELQKCCGGYEKEGDEEKVVRGGNAHALSMRSSVRLPAIVVRLRCVVPVQRGWFGRHGRWLP